MLIEHLNKQAALDALNEPFTNTRTCVSVKPADEVFRFVKDNRPVTITIDSEDLLFSPVPYAEFGEISSGDGVVADSTSITLDGRNMTGVIEENPSDIISGILAQPLANRPIQIATLVYNVETYDVIGLIPEFVGFVDTPVYRRIKEDGTASALLEIDLLSFRAAANRRVASVYDDIDHQTRFPGDRALQWISNNVFRLGKFPWNEESGSGGGSSGAGSNPTQFSPAQFLFGR